MEDQIRELMEDILGISKDSIDESTSMDNTESWDSMNHINLCLSIEQEFDISLEVYEIEAMLSFYDVVQVVATKL